MGRKQIDNDFKKGISKRVDGESGEVFWDVTVQFKGQVIAKEAGFTERPDAEAFYWKHADRCNIRKRRVSDGVRFDAEFYRGGGKRPLRKSFLTFSEAVRWRRECRELKSSTSDNWAYKTFREFSRYWYENEVKVKRRPNTRKGYKSQLRNHINPVIGDIRIIDIKARHIDQIMAAMQAKNCAPSTLNLAQAVVGRCIKYANLNEILDKNVMSLYSKMENPEKEGVYLEKGEITRLLSVSKGTNRYILYLTALRTGMRKGEILALVWNSINFKTNRIKVMSTRTGDIVGTTKSGKERFIPISSDLKTELLALRDERRPKPDDLVFLGKRGGPVNYQGVGQYFKEDLLKAGVMKAITFHGLRHTFASHYIQCGGDRERLQAILGHADAKMTQRYRHLSDEFMDQAICHIENLDLK